MSGSTNGGPGGWEPPSVEELHGLLPQYEIESILGQGGMGAVYKGKQATLQRTVAIKVLPEFLAEGGDDLQYVERFKLEARSMASLDHPAIISVFDFGQTEKGHLFFVMEFIDGMDIENYISAAGGVVDSEHAVAITSHVLDALEYAHAKGMVHRDIKPANVLINREGRVKIADFGLVKQLAGEDAAELSSLTMENVAMGTPDYIAPEALEMSGTPDHRADLYAVGVMLYKMLTGKLPRGLFKMPSEESDSLDPRFDDIITLAMESNPEGRFQNATEFRSKLDELQSEPVDRIGPDQVSGEVSPAVSGSVVNAGATNPPPSSPAPKTVRTGASRKSPPQTKSSGIGLGFTMLGVFSVLAVASYFLLLPKDNGDEISEASKREMPPPESELETSGQEVDLTATTPDTNPSDSRVTQVTESTPPALEIPDESPGNADEVAGGNEMPNLATEDETNSARVSGTGAPPEESRESASTMDLTEDELILIGLPEFASRISNFQAMRRGQLKELANKYLVALRNAESAAIQSGDLTQVEKIQEAIERGSNHFQLIEDLPGQKTASPLPPLPPLDANTPESLQRLRGIFDNETAKIEKDVFALLSDSLGTLQTDLVKQNRLEDARTVSRYREEVSSAKPFIATAAPSSHEASITPEGQTALEFEIKTVKGTEFHCWRSEKTELQLLSSDWTADDIAPFILLLDELQRLIEEMSGLNLSGPGSELLTFFEDRGWIPMGTNGDPRVGLPMKETEESIRQFKQNGKTPHFYLAHLTGRIKFDYISKLDFPHELRNSHSTNAIAMTLSKLAAEELNLTFPRDFRSSKLYGQRAFETFKEIPISWEEAMESGFFGNGNQKVNIREIYDYIYIELISKVGVEEFFKPFIEKVASLPDTKNAQDAIDNFYTAATHAAGREATEFLITDMRMPVSDSLR